MAEPDINTAEDFHIYVKVGARVRWVPSLPAKGLGFVEKEMFATIHNIVGNAFYVDWNENVREGAHKVFSYDWFSNTCPSFGRFWLAPEIDEWVDDFVVLGAEK